MGEQFAKGEWSPNIGTVGGETDQTIRYFHFVDGLSLYIYTYILIRGRRRKGGNEKKPILKTPLTACKLLVEGNPVKRSLAPTQTALYGPHWSPNSRLEPWHRSENNRRKFGK